MSSNKQSKRNDALKRRVANLAREGATYREIASIVGKRPEQIKPLREAGERLLSEALGAGD